MAGLLLCVACACGLSACYIHGTYTHIYIHIHGPVVGGEVPEQPGDDHGVDATGEGDSEGGVVPVLIYMINIYVLIGGKKERVGWDDRGTNRYTVRTHIYIYIYVRVPPLDARVQVSFDGQRDSVLGQGLGLVGGTEGAVLCCFRAFVVYVAYIISTYIYVCVYRYEVCLRSMYVCMYVYPRRHTQNLVVRCRPRPVLQLLQLPVYANMYIYVMHIVCLRWDVDGVDGMGYVHAYIHK